MKSKAVPWWMRIESLTANEKREILQNHRFGTIAQTEDPDIVPSIPTLDKTQAQCRIMLFGYPQVGKSTTINTFKKAFNSTALSLSFFLVFIIFIFTFHLLIKLWSTLASIS
jgi:ribosome biogenesis GTPase A